MLSVIASYTGVAGPPGGHFYRPRSRGDNAFGSVRVFVCVFVCPSSPVPRSRGDNTFSSVHPSVRTGVEWSILVLGFAKYSKRSSEMQVSYTLNKNIIECASQGPFKMAGRSKWLCL